MTQGRAKTWEEAEAEVEVEVEAEVELRGRGGGGWGQTGGMGSTWGRSNAQPQSDTVISKQWNPIKIKEKLFYY